MFLELCFVACIGPARLESVPMGPTQVARAQVDPGRSTPSKPTPSAPVHPTQADPAQANPVRAGEPASTPPADGNDASATPDISVEDEVLANIEHIDIGPVKVQSL